MNEVRKNGVYRVNIEDWSAEGLGIARLGGLVVFVKNGVRGDVCDVRIEKVAKSAAWARAVEITEPSPARIPSGCPYFPRCGGCDFQHVAYGEELRFKKDRVVEALRRIGGAELLPEEVVGADSLEAYRNKAVFPVGQREGKAVTGFYRERSHDIVPVENCAVQTEQANRAARAVRAWMDETGVPAYGEAGGRGVVRRVFARVNARGRTLVCVVSAEKPLPEAGALVSRLREALPGLTGVVLNVNNSRGNAVLSGEFVTLWGEPAIEDELCSLSFRLSAPSFYQVNRAQAEKLYARAMLYADLDKTRTALDLYCGTGTLTLCMAKRAGYAVGAEIVAEAVEDARENARRNGVLNAEFLCADAAEAVKELRKRDFRPDVILVDPPRKGLDETVIGSVGAFAPQRLVYVSCDPGTLARDVRRLSAYGYFPRRLTVVDMFPRTRHVECVVLMSRVENQP